MENMIQWSIVKKTLKSQDLWCFFTIMSLKIQILTVILILQAGFGNGFNFHRQTDEPASIGGMVNRLQGTI